MFKWYFEKYFVENYPLFWIGIIVIVLIILMTIYLVYRELKRDKHVNK